MSSIDSSITGLIAAQQASFSSNISIAVAAKQLDAYKQQGDAVVSLLEGAVQLSKEVGKGGQIDSVA
ncbi:MAG: putative motility protein [Planctomycetaceae bacterium]|nr:putative motility protein [Planctomycetales bacterium]MCB9926536.1 putative motility protein [Planctomycetaceae bacterium]